jgi:hypothetical protein
MKQMKPIDVIHFIRKDKGVTKKWLSDKIGVRQNNIDSALSSSKKTQNIFKALDALGMDVTIIYKKQKIKLV